MAMADVMVMGAGIFGLSVAYACARRGAKVAVVDPSGVGAGASGGIVGALAPHVPENWNAKKAFQLESLLMAESYWADVGERSGISSGYGRLGRIQPLADDKAVARARERAVNARTLWQGAARWQVITSVSQEWSVDSPSGHFVFDDLTARIQPMRACQSLAAAIQSLGGFVHEESKVRAGAVVWATGWRGLQELSDDLGRWMGSGVKGQAALFALDARTRPQLFADALHIVPHANGAVAVGSTSERTFEDPTGVDQQVDGLIAQARALVPALADAAVIDTWAGVRPRAPSRAPILGPWPGRPGHFIANGGFKIGFGMAPLIGEVLADLVLERRDAIPEDFRLTAE
ncbi:MAG: FAD-dependent oxidoreductase [Pseudomonadota bacterium]